MVVFDWNVLESFNYSNIRGCHIRNKKTVCIYLLPYTCHIPRPSHSPPFDHPNNISRGVQIVKLLTMYFLQFPFTFFLLGPNIFLSSLWSNILSQFSYTKATHKVLHSQTTTLKIIPTSRNVFVWYILTSRVALLQINRCRSIPGDVWLANWKSTNRIPLACSLNVILFIHKSPPVCTLSPVSLSRVSVLFAPRFSLVIAATLWRTHTKVPAMSPVLP